MWSVLPSGVDVPASELLRPARRLRSLRLWHRRHRAVHQQELLARALQEVRIRVETLRAQLASLGLRSRQVAGEELARLYHSCLTPERALQHPLIAQHLGSVGHFPRVVSAAPSRTLALIPEEPESEERAIPALTPAPASEEHTAPAPQPPFPATPRRATPSAARPDAGSARFFWLCCKKLKEDKMRK